MVNNHQQQASPQKGFDLFKAIAKNFRVSESQELQTTLDEINWDEEQALVDLESNANEHPWVVAQTLTTYINYFMRYELDHTFCETMIVDFCSQYQVRPNQVQQLIELLDRRHEINDQ